MGTGRARVGPEDGEHRWVAKTANCVLTDDGEDAQWFQVTTSVPPAAQLRIERREHELAGGLKKFLDLHAGVEGAYKQLELQLASHIWPGGRPDRKTVEEAKAQSEAIEIAFRADDSQLKNGYESLMEMVGRISFLAAWPDIVVDAPSGWADLASKDMSRHVVQWMQSAYLEAVGDAVRGKTQPSA